jgi:hypothetical protein
METKSRVKKTEMQKYITFIQSDETQNALKSIPKHLQQRYLREGFFRLTGLKISEFTHYKLMKALITNKAVLGDKTFIII